MKVIGLERGPRLTTEDFNPHDELRYFQRQDLRPNIKRQPVTWRPNANARANPMPVLNNGNQAGGGTVHYGAVSWRMHEDDFRARSHTIERYGASAIPTDSSLADWPLSYADLEPFYDRAEYELGVSGKAGNLQGKKIDGGNVFEAPRRREYPLPPLLSGPGRRSCSTPAAASSAITRSRPRARSSRSPIRAGRAAPIAASARPSAVMSARSRRSSSPSCPRPTPPATSSSSPAPCAIASTATTAAGRPASPITDPTARTTRSKPRLVILTTFIYDNTRLLLLSKTEKFPNGLANSSGHLGKHMMAHMMAERVRRLRRPAHQHLYGAERAEAYARRLQRRQFRPQGLGLHPRLADLDRHRQPAGRPDRTDHHRHAARRAALGGGLSRLPRDILHPPRRRWWRRPRTCPMPTRPSTSIRTCKMPGACRRHA